MGGNTQGPTNHHYEPQWTTMERNRPQNITRKAFQPLLKRHNRTKFQFGKF